MGKFFKALVATVVIALFIIPATVIAWASGSVFVVVDGQEVYFPDQQPVIVDGRTLVPIHGVFQALGWDVVWQPETTSVLLTNEYSFLSISITIGASTFDVAAFGLDKPVGHGSVHPLEVPAQIIGSRTMLPLRAVLESVGYVVDWDYATNTIIVSSPYLQEDSVEKPQVVSTPPVPNPQIDGTRFYSHGVAVYVHSRFGMNQETVDSWVGMFLERFDNLDTTGSQELVINDIGMGQLRPLGLGTFGFADDVPQSVIDRRNAVVQELDDFVYFVAGFTQTIIEGATTGDAKIKAVYDFIILNFSYQDQRDGATIDGTGRPAHYTIPQPSFVNTRADGAIYLTAVITENHDWDRLFAWLLLLEGEGVCDHFAALFAIMLQTMGIEAKRVGGYYVNRDGSQVGHAWTAVRLDGNWYYFDPQIEASWFKRNRANYSAIPYHWFRQPVGGALANSRYRLDETRHSLD
ncbi:MAG: stalk domain-containing protein [Defluviitaleaceae bacterium]|nr:stalk domain-containing protein [Defluviitaleaceae bacterium]